ncbi:hypothetical protein VNI00_004334 [Paramarasmius palmivorus]|uniref:Copper radical oxidase n=1 Tax=Paramarasmius palmivorus TaxID=297713 RepID=A0AAW0DP11_9AGAR
MFRSFASPSFISLVLAVPALCATVPRAPFRSRGFASGEWSLEQQGTTGVSAQQLAVVSEKTVVIFDKIENNQMKNNAGNSAWGSEFDLETKQARPLNPVTNTWCGTGNFLGNGTFISTGGTDGNGFQGIRLFDPCTDGTCDIFEDPNSNLRLDSQRWYPSSTGSTVVLQMEGFNGVSIHSQFMEDTVNGNHFPILVQLPDGNIFVAANQAAMIFDWKTNTERRLPGIPNGVRISSPFSAGATLLPLTPENNYTPEILICGGSTVDDKVAPNTLSSQTPASAQCSRMVLNEEGIAAGWKIESMPTPRVMPELVILPDQRVLIVNGAQTGVAGYGNASSSTSHIVQSLTVGDQVGASNADNPALTPVIYDPTAPAGSRFSSAGIPASAIPRMYHSTATLTPNGTVMLAGSNPNDNVSEQRYPTEYRVEFYSPPYMSQDRPTYTGLPDTIDFNGLFILTVKLPKGVKNVSVYAMDLGFATHGVHMDQRSVKLNSILLLDKLTVFAPPSGKHYPPGPAFIYVVTDSGVPSFGHKIIIGNGASPPVDQGAIANMLLSGGEA